MNKLEALRIVSTIKKQTNGDQILDFGAGQEMKVSEALKLLNDYIRKTKIESEVTT